MNQIISLTKRNIKLFFRDKGLFFTALITPMILLVLYSTFLGNIYKDSIRLIIDGINTSLPDKIEISDALLNGFVGGQLISSILAVSCVTVAISCNMIMVQDKANGVYKDLMISPLNSSYLAISYYIATLTSTLLICFTALAVSFIYLAFVGFYMTVLDVLLIICDVLILVMFGTALSSLINFFLSTQGQISAVGSIISSTYGFICGAYMPISQFSDGLRNIVCSLPGTYGTSLLRHHALRGVTEKMLEAGLPEEALRSIRDSVDYHIYLGNSEIPGYVKYIALIGTMLLLLGIYIALNIIKNKKRK